MLFFLLFLIPLAIAQTPMPVTCTPPGPKFGDKFYAVDNNPKSWYEAESACYNSLGHLATSSDGFTNTFLTNLTGITGDLVWIGCNVDYTNNWSWSDRKQNYSYSNWASSKNL